LCGGIFHQGEKTMTEKQKIEKQDFVDNAIFELAKTLNPSNKEIEWDIEWISQIRDVLVSLYVDKMKVCTKYQFYP
jgi:hypothetical protein